MKQCNTPNGMKKSGPISVSEIYIVRLFYWEEDQYFSWLYFNFGEGWKAFAEMVEDFEANFTGGMITPEGHYYLAQTEEFCLQLCPFINQFNETETEDL